jgi:hypothetical protein
MITAVRAKNGPNASGSAKITETVWAAGGVQAVARWQQASSTEHETGASLGRSSWDNWLFENALGLQGDGGGGPLRHVATEGLEYSLGDYSQAITAESEIPPPEGHDPVAKEIRFELTIQD